MGDGQIKFSEKRTVRLVIGLSTWVLMMIFDTRLAGGSLLIGTELRGVDLGGIGAAGTSFGLSRGGEVCRGSSLQATILSW